MWSLLAHDVLWLQLPEFIAAESRIAPVAPSEDVSVTGDDGYDGFNGVVDDSVPDVDTTAGISIVDDGFGVDDANDSALDLSLFNDEPAVEDADVMMQPMADSDSEDEEILEEGTAGF